MNDKTQGWKKATSQKEEKVKTKALWLSWKAYHNRVVYHRTRMHSFLEVESLGEIRCRKSWNQFNGYDSLSIRCVMRVSGKRKDHRWEKWTSKFLIKVPVLWNSRTGPMKRLNDSSDVPKIRLGILLKTFTSSKKKTRLHSTFPRRNWFSQLRQQKSRKKESLW